MDLQVIVLLADKENEPIDFFTDNELKALQGRDMGTLIEDKEGYSNQYQTDHCKTISLY